MKETLSTNEVAERLLADENANWTWAGAQALAEYLEELESDMGEEIEFDRVALRCDFSQWDSLQEWAHDHFSNAWEELGIDETDLDSDEFDEAIRDYINDRGTLIEFDGGIIVSSF